MNRFAYTKKAGIIGIIGNIFLILIKATIGSVSGSQAMIADSINSAGDAFASVMTYIGSKVASKKQDSDHNFGHGKAEYFFSLLISISMIMVTVKLFISSVLALINGSNFRFSWWLVVVCITTIVIKFSMFIYTTYLLKKYKNLLLESSRMEHLCDCVTITFTLISVLLSLKNIYWFDSVVSMGISIWIFYTGLKLFIASFNVLMDKSMDEEQKEKLKTIIDSIKEIKGIEHFNTVPVGYKYLVSITIFVDGNLSTYESHEIADKLERELEKLDYVYATIIHVEPIKVK